MAAVAAGPVFRLLGKKDLGTSEFPPVETGLVDGELAFRQHRGGHTTGPPTGRRSWRSPTATSRDRPPRYRGRRSTHNRGLACRRRSEIRDLLAVSAWIVVVLIAIDINF